MKADFRFAQTVAKQLCLGSMVVLWLGACATAGAGDSPQAAAASSENAAPSASASASASAGAATGPDAGSTTSSSTSTPAGDSSNGERAPASARSASGAGVSWYHIYEQKFAEANARSINKADKGRGPASAEQEAKLDNMIDAVINEATWLVVKDSVVAAGNVETPAMGSNRSPANSKPTQFVKRAYLKSGPYFCSVVAFMNNAGKANSNITCFDSTNPEGLQATKSF